MSTLKDNGSLARKGVFISYTVSIITLVTFGLAMMAVPPSGPFCEENCMEYPYLDSLGQYPRDYIWMYLALVQVVVFLVFMSIIHLSTKQERKVFSLPALLFATITSMLLLLTYYVQAVVVPQSLYYGETDGIALLTQYNGNGIFIAQEEIAYMLMSLSLFFASWVFSEGRRRDIYLRWLFRIPLIVNLFSLVFISVKFGFEKSYRFEIVTITSSWLILIIAGFSMAGWFRSEIRK
jgi:prepilin signal peptidase PulO-like enzyme (type II secretory pathway)